MAGSVTRPTVHTGDEHGTRKGLWMGKFHKKLLFRHRAEAHFRSFRRAQRRFFLEMG